MRAPLLASPAVSGRVPHGSSVEQLLHGGAAGKPVAAAIRDRDGASAAFTASGRSALWSDRHPSTTALSGRVGVGNYVAEADAHLRYADGDAAAARATRGMSERRFDEWRKDRDAQRGAGACSFFFLCIFFSPNFAMLIPFSFFCTHAPTQTLC